MLLRRFASLVLPVVLAAPAWADDGMDQFEGRRAVYKRGLNAMLKQDWVEAERIFAELFRSQRTWDVAVSLGQSELNLKRYRDAAEHLSYGVQNFPIRDQREAYEDAKGGLEEAKRHVGTLSLVVNQDAATLSVDGKAIGRSPFAGEVFVEPGKHTLQASLQGYADVRQAIAIEAGATQKVELNFGPRLPESPPGEAAPRASDGSTADWAIVTPPRQPPNLIPAIVGGALALGGAGTFLGFTLAARQSESTLRDFTDKYGVSACAPSVEERPSECDDIAREGRTLDRNRNFATAGLIVAGGAVLGTVAYYVFFSSPKRAASTGMPGVLRATRVSAGVSTRSANIDVAYSF